MGQRSCPKSRRFYHVRLAVSSKKSTFIELFFLRKSEEQNVNTSELLVGCDISTTPRLFELQN